MPRQTKEQKEYYEKLRDSGVQCICVRKCYHLQKVWEPGEALPLGWLPNKHFAPASEAVIEDQPIKRTHADDPRGTEEMLEILKEKYGVEMKEDADRKDVWLALSKRESDDRQGPTQTANAKKQGADDPKHKPAAGGVIPDKNFDQFTPDDWDAITKQGIIDAVQKKYKQDITPANLANTKKDDLMAAALKVEQEVLASNDN